MNAKEEILFQLVQENKVIFYELMMKKLECNSIAEVDAIILQCMKMKLFAGHIDHKQNCLFVSSVKIDKANISDIPNMVKTLEGLVENCDKALEML